MFKKETREEKRLHLRTFMLINFEIKSNLFFPLSFLVVKDDMLSQEQVSLCHEDSSFVIPENWTLVSFSRVRFFNGFP